MTESEQQSIKSALSGVNRPVILEAGAHTGEETFQFEELLGRPFRHVLIEPDPRNVQHILDHVGPTAYENRAPRPLGPMRRLILGAVSDACDFREFWFSNNSEDQSHSSGSLLEPTGHLVHYKHVSFPYKGMVVCWTLDEIFRREYLSWIDLLYSDVQGSEAAMIRGGTETLTHTHYLFMEVERSEMYRGEALRDDLIAMLPGWDLAGDFGVNILMRNKNFGPL